MYGNSNVYLKIDIFKNQIIESRYIFKEIEKFDINFIYSYNIYCKLLLDDKQFIVCFTNFSTYIYNIETNQIIRNFKLNPFDKFLFYDNKVIITLINTTIKIINTNTLETIKIINLSNLDTKNIHQLNLNNYLNNTNSIQTNKSIMLINKNKINIYLTTNEYLIYSFDDSNVYVYNYITNNLIMYIIINNKITKINLTNDNKCLILSTNFNKTFLINIQSLEIIKMISSSVIDIQTILV